MISLLTKRLPSSCSSKNGEYCWKLSYHWFLILSASEEAAVLYDALTPLPLSLGVKTSSYTWTSGLEISFIKADFNLFVLMSNIELGFGILFTKSWKDLFTFPNSSILL